MDVEEIGSEGSKMIPVQRKVGSYVSEILISLQISTKIGFQNNL